MCFMRLATDQCQTKAIALKIEKICSHTLRQKEYGCGQSYECSTIINYDSRVVMTKNLKSVQLWCRILWLQSIDHWSCSLWPQVIDLPHGNQVKRFVYLLRGGEIGSRVGLGTGSKPILNGLNNGERGFRQKWFEGRIAQSLKHIYAGLSKKR